MGKKLIITGADFSTNGIAPDHIELAWIGNGAVNTSNMRLTGFTSNCKMVLKFSANKTKYQDPTAAFFICGSLASGKNFGVCQTASHLYAYYTNQMLYAKATDVNIADGSDVELELSKYGLVVNGTTCPITGGSISDEYDIPYFGIDACVGSTGNGMPPFPLSNEDPGIRIMGVKIYSNVDNANSLVVDAIPVKRITDNVVCLYNKVDGTYIERADNTQPAYGEFE